MHALQFDISFHDVDYVVTLSTINGDTLCVEVEQKSDASRWRGDFTSRCEQTH
jgi:coiled-coil domain-containing protein 61